MSSTASTLSKFNFNPGIAVNQLNTLRKVLGTIVIVSDLEKVNLKTLEVIKNILSMIYLV